MKNISLIALVTLILLIILLVPVLGFSNDIEGFALGYNHDTPLIDIDINGNLVDSCSGVNTSQFDPHFPMSYSLDDNEKDENNKKVFPPLASFFLNVFVGFGMGTGIQIRNFMVGPFIFEFGVLIAGSLGVSFLNSEDIDYKKEWVILAATGFSLLGFSRIFLGMVSPFLVESRPLWYSIMLDVIYGFGAGSAFKGDVKGWNISTFIYLGGLGASFGILVAEFGYLIFTSANDNDYNHKFMNGCNIALIVIAAAILLADRSWSIYRTVEVHRDPTKIVKPKYFWKRKKDNDEENTNTNNANNDEEANSNNSNTNNNDAKNDDNDAPNDDTSNDGDGSDEDTESDDNQPTEYMPIIGISPSGGLILGFSVWF